MSSTDTIFALATPLGKSGVAVIRLSGPKALVTARTITGLSALTPRHAYYTVITDPATGQTVDHGLALYFQAPHSFTGEDVVELHLHGSLAVIRECLALLSAQSGMRPAERGEFTRRAFMNGKMDLTAAEGLADLIEAETSEQKTQATRQMEGELARFYQELRERIIRLLAHLEAYIDFPDEDIPESVLDAIASDTTALAHDIGDILKDNRGERLREGIHVVILGAPNVGKSSLLNLLAKRDAAIVSAQAGTTRDIIEIHLDMGGYPVILADTAGIRDSAEEIEQEGIRRAKAKAERADIKLVLFDGAAWPERDTATQALIDGNAIPIISKSDVLTGREEAKFLYLSAKMGEGVETLLQRLEQRIMERFTGMETPMITRHRHRALLEEARNYLEKSITTQPLELKCEELRRAALAVGKITGKIQVDDVLDVLFKSFCIGK